MANPYRALPLIVVGTLSLGAMSLREPRELVPVRDEAPLLDAFYASPVERVETHVLRRGETLSGVLARSEITGMEISNLLLALREYSNPRRLVAGAEVTIRHWVRDGSPRAVELRLNADSTVRLDRRPVGWESSIAVTPTVVDTGYVGGRIAEGQSLFHALVKDESLDLPYSERTALVYALAEIFEYQLDFQNDIRAGDTYRVAYEREVRPDGTARSRRILVAEFENRGRSFSAVLYAPRGETFGYYDFKGESVRRGFRRYPVDFRVTSSFSSRRFHPILGVHRAHLGTDFGAPSGTPVKATADGTVVSASHDGGYGNMVTLRHHGGYTTRYAHLSRFATGIRPGRPVQEGQVIGYVGATGLATGPHLHYELRKDGKPLDPIRATLPGAPPVPKQLLPEFHGLRDQRVALLERATVAGPRLAAADQPDGPPAGE
jgi:murein DD-endopeptidase MepM/ murein hydrolase activator NlpD